MLSPNLLDYIPLARDYRVMDVAAPGAFWDRSLLDLQLRKRFGLFVIALKRPGGDSFEFLPGPDHVIDRTDVLVVIGRESDIIRMRQATEDGADGAP
jgi:trk system potassium uptake protein TrkA